MNDPSDETKYRYPHLYMPKEGYVFIITYGRSGSTLTQNLLNSLPGYCIRGENSNLLYFLSKAADLCKYQGNFVLRRSQLQLPFEERKQGLKSVLGSPRDPWYGAELTNPEHFACSLYDTFCREILHLDERVRVGGFKEIRYHHHPEFFYKYLDMMKNIFPNCRFIFQTRNSDQVAKSSWWKKMDPSAVKKILMNSEKMFKHYSTTRDNCHFIRYENYQSNPEETLEKLFEFLGERFDMNEKLKILSTKLMH